MAQPELIKDIEARVIRPTSTDNAIVRFDGTTGQVQNTGNIIDDNNNVTFQKVINSGAICINGRNFNNEVINSTTGGTLFGVEYDDINHFPENGIVQIRGEGGSFGLASHCSYTDGISENIIGKRCFYKNAENNYAKNNNYALTPTALILKNDGHLKYYIGNTKVYSKNEEVIMNEYEVLHTGNINLADGRFVKKSGDTMTGQLNFSRSNGIYTRHIDGSLDGFSGELYLNYNNNAVIRVGHGGNYYISADGSFYSGTANTSYDLYPLKNDMIYTTSTGWYKIAYYANPSDTPRSEVDFIIQGVGGSVGPTTTRISFLLNWGSLGCNEIIIDGDSTYAGGARITKDANYTYLEIYVRNIISSNGSCFLRVLRNFNNSLSNNSFYWYTGNLPVSTATSTGLSLMHNATGLSRTGRITANAVYGAVWNDYAEYRKAESIEPGRVVVESADGEMKLSTERLQPGAEIISDTFGFAIGETDEYKTPIAATGRVLAYPNEDRYSYPLGCAVCSGPNGTVSQMTREEIREYPERIIGTVSEIPEYKNWGTGNVKVDGRIWIRIK